MCCFRKGHQGNPISLAPDGAIAILDRAHRDRVQGRIPYVCTIKAIGSDREGRRSYIVRLDRPLTANDYDELLHADLQGRRMRVRLRYPTHFASLRTRLVDADTEEQAIVEDGRPVALLVRLRHGQLSAEAELTPDEAIRRGVPINALIPAAEAHAPPRLRHPSPRTGPADWRPSHAETVGYLARSTQELAALVPLAMQNLAEDVLQAIAVHRATEVTALRAYDAIPPDARDAVALELALTAIVRLACLSHDDPRARRRLALAEKRLLLARGEGLSAEAYAGLLQRLGLPANLDGEAVGVPLRAFLDATPGRRDGAWNLNKLGLEDGRVRLPPDLARLLLADFLHDARLVESVTLPNDVAAFIRPVQDRITRVLDLLDADAAVAKEAPCAFEAYPPCIQNTLRRARRDALTEAESQNALGFLTRIGVPSAAATRSLNAANDEERYRTRNASGRLDAKRLRPLPCDVNRLLGTCRWDCGVQSPLEHHAETA